MSKEQWTVLGLLVVLASLEVIRSPNVRGFFSSFFGQFGVGSKSSGFVVQPGSFQATPSNPSNLPASGGTQSATNRFRGMPNT